MKTRIAHRGICGLVLLTLATAASGFGTVFTTPEQRAKLDKQRQKGVINRPTLDTTAIPPRRQSRVSFDGYVIRKGGPDTAWVDKKMTYEGADNAARVNLQHNGATAATVRPSPGSRTVRMRPGQNVHIETGVVEESYAQRPVKPAHPTRPEGYSAAAPIAPHPATPPKQIDADSGIADCDGSECPGSSP